MTAQVNWMESEWATDGFAANFDGFDADVYPDEIAGKGWVWTVRATAEVSEWPELQDTGRNMTAEVAKKRAEVALRRAAKRNAGRRVAY